MINTPKCFTRAFFACIALSIFSPVSWGAILKRFDAKEPKQEGYLKSFRPPALSFLPSTPLPADRYSLLSLPLLPMDSNVTDSNATIDFSTTAPPAEVPEPVQQQPETQANPLDGPELFPPSVLPQADPFDVAAQREPSTDDLIEALENEQSRVSAGVPAYVPFVPPFSVTPANLEIRSKATYERRVRK